jgi:hypothetical protein
MAVLVEYNSVQDLKTFAVPAIVRTLSDCKVLPVLEAATQALVSVVAFPEMREPAAQNGAIKALVTCCESNMRSAVLLSLACRALRGIAAGSHPNQIAAVDAGAATLCLQALKTLDAACVPAVQALGNFSIASENKARMVEMGAIKEIVNVMRKFPNEPTLQQHGCRALRNLSKSKPTPWYLLQDAGVVAAVLAALTSACDHPAPVVAENALNALAVIGRAYPVEEQLCLVLRALYIYHQSPAMVKAVTGALVGLLEMERDLPDLIVAARDRVHQREDAQETAKHLLVIFSHHNKPLKPEDPLNLVPTTAAPDEARLHRQLTTSHLK